MDYEFSEEKRGRQGVREKESANGGCGDDTRGVEGREGKQRKRAKGQSSLALKIRIAFPGRGEIY